MTTFSYYPNIPNGPDNPSFDQPLMQTNSQSINSIINVDHLTFNSSGSGGPGTSAGQHKQVTFNGKNVPGGTPTDPLSIMYTNNIISAGSFNTTSASTVAEVFYQNNSGIFPVSMIKAFGSFDNMGNPLNTWNIALSTPGGHPTPGTFIMQLNTNVVTGNNYIVLATSSVTLPNINYFTVNYIISTMITGQFTLLFKLGIGPLDPPQFSVLVLQL